MTDAATLPTRRAELVERIAATEREQGAALLDGGEADGATLLVLHGELSVLDAAESEAARRAREAETEAAHAVRVEAAKEAATHLQGLRDGIAAAEDHSGKLGAALRGIMASAAALRKLAGPVGIHTPGQLDVHHLPKALSFAIGEDLSGIEKPRIFGHFNWPSHPTRQDWQAAERPIVAAFSATLEGLAS